MSGEASGLAALRRFFTRPGPPPPAWWWACLAAMTLLFALLRVLLEMDSGASASATALSAAGVEGVEGVEGAGGGTLTALEAFLRSCVPPAGAGAEEWWLWAFFMADLAVMGAASLLAVWACARPRLEGLGLAARIPLDDEAKEGGGGV